MEICFFLKTCRLKLRCLSVWIYRWNKFPSKLLFAPFHRNLRLSVFILHKRMNIKESTSCLFGPSCFCNKVFLEHSTRKKRKTLHEDFELTAQHHVSCLLESSFLPINMLKDQVPFYNTSLRSNHFNWYHLISPLPSPVIPCFHILIWLLPPPAPQEDCLSTLSSPSILHSLVCISDCCPSGSQHL